MSRPQVVIALLVVGLCLSNLLVTLHRSLIPVGVEGVITDMEVRFEKQRGQDDVHLIRVGGRRLRVDASAGGALKRGDHVRKRPLTTVLETPRGPIPLRPSQDFTRMLIVMPLTMLMALVSLQGPSSGRRPGGRTGVR
jgi:hypothetical protein